MQPLSSLLATVASELEISTDPERIYALNLELSQLDAELSQNSQDALNLRRRISTHPETGESLLLAWRAVSRRLREEDEEHRAAREEAAVAALEKSAGSTSAARISSPVIGQVYEMVAQLGRVTRDILPGVEEAKAVVLPCEPYLRSTLYRLTTFDRINDPELIPAHRALLQALSNLVAPVNEAHEWVHELWGTYNLGNREDAVMLRTLDSGDAMTVMACLMLTLNFIRADAQVGRSLGTNELRPLLARILDKVGAYSDGESGSVEERCFHLGYQLFSMLFHQGLQGALFSVLASPNEPITPSQTTLLQLLDGYHHNSEWDAQVPETSNTDSYAFLIPAFFNMAEYAIAAMTPLVGRSEEVALDDDPKLPRVFEACILACQCLITVCLAEMEHPSPRDGLLRAIRSAKRGEKYFVEVLIDLLGTTETFIPRVKPFRPNDPTRPEQTDTGMAGFAPLKRDLVQLAGLLANDDKETQDRIRECGGMQVVLSMCVTDDRNPLIREYALLAVRNLMINNVQNQAVIKEMDPLGVVGPDGELREMPARMGGTK